MTNNKLKHAAENILFLEACKENTDNIARLLIVLHRDFKASKKSCSLAVKELASTAEQFNVWEREGVFDHKLGKLCEPYPAVNSNATMELVVKSLKRKYSPQYIVRLTENYQIAIATACELLGFGAVRSQRLMDKLAVFTNLKVPNPQKVCDVETGVTFEADSFDDYISDVRKTYANDRKQLQKDREQHAHEVSEGLLALKKYQDEIRGKQ